MSAFGHAGFGSANRRNQLRAQGQIGADTYGQGVRNAMQAPTMNIYSAPQTYQQATGQQTQQPTSAPHTNQPSTPAGQPAEPVYKTDNEQPDMQTYTPPPSPGTAQPIQPQSTGTPYGGPSPEDTEENNNPARQPTFESNVYTGPPGLRNQPRRFQDMNRQRNSTDFIGQSFGEGVGQAMGLGSAGQAPRPGTGRDDVVMAFGRPVAVESDLAYQHYTSMLQMGQRNGLAPEQLFSSQELAKAQRALQWGQKKEADEKDRAAQFQKQLDDEKKAALEARQQPGFVSAEDRLRQQQQESLARWQQEQKPRLVQAIPGSESWSDATWQYLMSLQSGRNIRPSMPVWTELTFPGQSMEQVRNTHPALEATYQNATDRQRYYEKSPQQQYSRYLTSMKSALQ